ncbi:hypothetical protein PYVVs2_gp4 [Potato yellow vein virus]|uniref:p10 n=1 Tax=Potato yellow vein virus TaxID=103881 RepID=Q70PI2_9CLOS|nr:hypothetical protein PYVVs2_gp4 [Potato yellow vein virus]AMR69008.1 hypothetical protein [Potato yellow vein virus]AYJ76768.1 p10 [Potato yellow vein virus]QCI62254.1 hypothetical protein PYVVs2_gp4 [Potato yellow vein virus]QEY87992.1 p10 [Potato yellow vein virus]QHW06860.1 p10 [Potato yellow vein virus]
MNSISELITEFGEDRVDEIFALHRSFGQSNPPLCDVLLNLISSKLFSHDDVFEESIIEFGDLKSFLLVTKFIRGVYNSRYNLRY